MTACSSQVPNVRCILSRQTGERTIAERELRFLIGGCFMSHTWRGTHELFMHHAASMFAQTLALQTKEAFQPAGSMPFRLTIWVLVGYNTAWTALYARQPRGSVAGDLTSEIVQNVYV